jgi:RHS repeat-associated protein
LETTLIKGQVNEYIYFNGQRVTWRQHGVGWFNYAADHLGSARVLVKSGQYTPCYDADSLPYGEEKVYTDTCPQNYKFTGQERDAESGLDYFGARHYASSLGRFLQVDPRSSVGSNSKNPQRWNRYAYTLNNPLRFFDPDGLAEVEATFRSFIPNEHQSLFQGDGRANSTARFASSRTSITVRFETDPAKPFNFSIVDRKVGETIFITGKTGTAREGLPNAHGYRDSEGNVLVTFGQQTGNPLLPLAEIRANLAATFTSDADQVRITGTVSDAPAHEMNVSVNGGATQNIPIGSVYSGFGSFYTFPVQDLMDEQVDLNVHLETQPLDPETEPSY